MKDNWTRKKLLTMLGASAFVLAACGGGETADTGEGGTGGTAGGNGGEEVTIQIMQGKVEFNSQFNELADLYMEENPNVTIEITSVGGGTDYLSQLTTKFSSGDEPEIFSISGPGELRQFQDSMSDMSDTESASAALEGTLEGITVDGEVLGVPYNLEGYGLIYNKRVFEEAGVNAEEISTFADLEQAVETIDSQKEDLGIEAVFALPGKETWVMTNHLGNTFLAPEYESALELSGSETIEFTRGDEYQNVLDLQANYSVQPVLSLDYSQQVEEYFSLEQVAIIQQGNWIYPTLEQMDPNFADNVGMMPIPVEGHENQLPVGVPNYWAVNSNSDEATVQASKDFLDWLNLSETGKEYVLNEFNFVPGYEGYDGSAIADPLSKVVFDYSQSGDTLPWVFPGFPAGWENESFGPNIQKYLDDVLTWDEALSQSQETWTEYQQQ